MKRRARSEERRASGRIDRAGLTLFEVIIALAIFVGSIAAIGQLISNGVRGAVLSRLQTQAVLRCETKLAEVVSGVTPLHSVSGMAFSDDATWTWSMTTAPGPHASLYIVEVTAAHPSSTTAGNVSYSLRRLVRDPQLEMQAYEKQLEQQAAASNTSSSSNSGSIGSSSSGASK